MINADFIVKACQMLASEQHIADNVRFRRTPLHEVMMTPLVDDVVDEFIQDNPQYIFSRYRGEYDITLNKASFNAQYCARCGYDQFELMTVARREVRIFRSSFKTLKIITTDHVVTCLCCQHKLYVDRR